MGAAAEAAEPAVTADRTEASYRALLALPSMARVVASMQLSRIAIAMLGITLTLFTLDAYGSPELAGIVSFASIVPGLLVSPIAGALLDRHGRVRLAQLDYLIAAAALVLIAALSLAGMLPAPLLVAIAAVSSITGPLSATGVRTLFPILVPQELWGRANAVDSNGFVLASVVGPPVAAALVAFAGAQAALILVAVLWVASAAILTGVREPRTEQATSGRLLRDAWDGLAYVARHPTLRGLGAGITLQNFAVGVVSIVLPILVLRRLGGSELLVGIAFAVTGLTGMATAFWFGRRDITGREKTMLVVSAGGTAPAVLLLAVAAGELVPVLAGWGLALVVLSVAIMGALNGPLDIALFTLRQQRTDRAWFGRAFAVSMSVNFAGFPVGAAVAGVLADRSLEAAIGVGAAACLAGAIAMAILIPRHGGHVQGVRRR